MPHCGSTEEILTEKAPLTRRRWASLARARTQRGARELPRSNRADTSAAGTGQASMLIIGGVLSAHAAHKGPHLLAARAMPLTLLFHHDGAHAQAIGNSARYAQDVVNEGEI